MRLASRMRATIWPTRPKPAMTTWPSFSGMRVEGARHAPPSAPGISSTSSSSGVAAIDRRDGDRRGDRRPAARARPTASAGGEQHEGELAALGDGERQPPRRARLQSGPAPEQVAARRS